MELVPAINAARINLKRKSNSSTMSNQSNNSKKSQNCQNGPDSQLSKKVSKIASNDFPVVKRNKTLEKSGNQGLKRAKSTGKIGVESNVGDEELEEDQDEKESDSSDDQESESDEKTELNDILDGISLEYLKLQPGNTIIKKENICAECEMSSDSLIECQGSCQSFFHLDCGGLLNDPQSNGYDFCKLIKLSYVSLRRKIFETVHLNRLYSKLFDVLTLLFNKFFLNNGR